MDNAQKLKAIRRIRDRWMFAIKQAKREKRFNCTARANHWLAVADDLEQEEKKILSMRK